MSYFENQDRFGFYESDPFNSSLGFDRGGVMPEFSKSHWLMGGSATGFDDAAGWAMQALGAVMITPGPAYAVAAGLGYRAAGPLGAGAAALAYLGIGMAVYHMGSELKSLD